MRKSYCVCLTLQEARENHAHKLEEMQYQSNKECVLAQLGKEADKEEVDLETLITDYSRQRKLRVEQFIEHIRTKHRLFLERVSPTS